MKTPLTTTSATALLWLLFGALFSARAAAQDAPPDIVKFNYQDLRQFVQTDVSESGPFFGEYSIYSDIGYTVEFEATGGEITYDVIATLDDSGPGDNGIFNREALNTWRVRGSPELGRSVTFDFIATNAAGLSVSRTLVLTSVLPDIAVRQISAIDPMVIEGETMSLNLLLINRPLTNDDIELDYNIVTSGVDAVAPEDRSGSVTFVAPNDFVTLELRTLAGDYGPDGQIVNIEFFDSTGSIDSIPFTVLDDTLEISLDTANPAEVNEGLPISLGLSRSGGPAGELTLGYNVISGANAIAPADRSAQVTFSATDDTAILTLDTVLGDYAEGGQPVVVEFFAPPDGTFPGGVIATGRFSVLEVPDLGVQLIASIDPTVIEGETIALDIQLINRPPTTDDIELDYNIISSGVDAIEPDDRSGSLTFVAPNDIATLELRTLAGDYGPDGQRVNLEFFNSTGGIGSITFTVVDDTLQISLDTTNPTEIIEGLPISLGLSRSGGPAGELTLGYNVISGANAIAAAEHGGGVTFSADDDSAALTLNTVLGDYPEDGQSVFVEFFAPPDGTFPGGVIATANFSVIENDKDNGPPPEFVRHETPISFDSALGYHETLTMLPPLTDGGYKIEFSMLVGTHVPVYLPILTRGEVDANDIEIYLQPQRGFANIAVVHNRGNGGPFDFVTYEFKDPLLETGDSNYYCAPVDVVVEYGGAGARALRVSVNGTELTPQPIATSTGWNDQDNLAPPNATTGNWWLGKFEHTSLDGVHYFNGDLGNLKVTRIDPTTGEQTPVGLVLVATDDDPGVGYDGANACPAEVVVNEGNTFTFGPIGCANPAQSCSANIFATFSNSAGQFDFSELFTISVDKFPDSASNWLDFDFKLFREAKADLVTTLSLEPAETAEITITTTADELIEGEETLIVRAVDQDSGQPLPGGTAVATIIDAGNDPAAPLCNGIQATIYVDGDNIIVGGDDDGQPYTGTLNGTSADDVIVATRNDDRIFAYAGNDLVCGRRGDDRIWGGADDDTLRGNRGRDVIKGGSGNDTLYGNRGHDTLKGGGGHDSAYGGRGTDHCRNVESIVRSCETW